MNDLEPQVKQSADQTQVMRKLENKIPPPIVVLLIGLAMWLVARLEPAFQINLNLRFAIAGTCVLVGLIVLALGVLAFRQAKTTINPVRPEAASCVVTGGVYRYTRNPMYVGFAAILVGWAFYLSVTWVFLGPLIFVLFTTRFQIVPEERVLSSKFGSAYDEYRHQARRWL